MAEDKIKIGDIEIGTKEAETKIKKVDAMLDELNKDVSKIEQGIQTSAKAIYDVESSSMYELGEDYTTKKVKVGGQQRSQKNAKQAKGVTFSMSKGKKTIDTLMDYGDDSVNLSTLEEAVNIRSDKTGELIDSAKQLRERFNLAKEGIIKFSKEQQQSILKIYREQGMNADQLIKKIQKIAGKSEIVGFNNANFDNQLMLEFAKTSKSSETQESYTKIFGSAKDVRKGILEQLEKSGMKNAMYTGKTNLQDLLALVTGSKDASAHNSQSDVASTQIVGEESLKQDNIFSKFGTIISRIATKKNIEYDTKNVNSEYRKIINEVYDILLRKIQNGEAINMEQIVSSYLGEIPQPKVPNKPITSKRVQKPKVYTAPTMEYSGKFILSNYNEDSHEWEEKQIGENYDSDYEGIRVGRQSEYVDKNGKTVKAKNIFKIGNSDYEDVSKRYTTITKDLENETLDSEARTKLEKEKQEIEESVIKAFMRSSEEAKEAFANNIYATKYEEKGHLSRVKESDSYLDNYALGKRIRASGKMFDYTSEYGLDVGQVFYDSANGSSVHDNSKVDEAQREKDFKKKDISTSIISTEEEAAAKEYLSSIINGLKTDKGFIGALKDGSPEIIEIIKKILSQGLGEVLNIDEEDLDQYFERLIMEKTSGLKDRDLEPSQRIVGKGAKFLSKKEENNIKSNEDLAEEEKEKEQSVNNIQVDSVKKKALTVVDVLKNGIISLIDEMQKEATPLVKEQLEKVKTRVGELYPLNNSKEYKSSLVDEAQSFNRAASLLTFSDTKDASIKDYMEKTGVDLKTAQGYVLGNEDSSVRQQYDVSKKAIDVFNKNGGTENIEEAWKAVTAIADKDIVEITEQLSRLPEEFYPQFLENVKNQLTPNAASINKYYWTKGAEQEGEYEKRDDIPEGLTPKQKTQRYYQEGMLLSPYLGEQVENSSGLSKYEIALKNAKNRLNTQGISEQESSQIQKDIIAIEQLISKKQTVVTLDKQDVELQEQERQLIEDTIKKISVKDIASGQGRKSAANIYNQAMLGLTSTGINSLDTELKKSMGEGNFKKLTSRARKDREASVNQQYVANVKERDKEESVSQAQGRIKSNSSFTSGEISIKNATVNIENANFNNGVSGNVINSNTSKEVEFQGVKLHGFKPIYNDVLHEYQDESGKTMLSSTQARDLLLKGKNPAFKNDLISLKDKVNSLPNGEILTPEQAGMSQKDYKFMAGVNVSGLKGDLFHHTIDAFVKEGVKGYDELKQKAPEVFNALEKELEETLVTIKKYGFDEDTLTTKKDVASYLDAIDKSGMTPTKFSEQQLGVTMTGSKGKVSFGVTPDQLYSGELGALVDNKTGKVKGYEAFQLMAQKIGLMANKSSLVDENGKSLLVDRNGKEINPDEVELYIADVKDGTTQLIKYLSLTVDDFYDLMIRAKDIEAGIAQPLSENEQKAIYNSQLKGNKIVGTSSIEDIKSNNQSIPIFSKTSDEDLLKYANKESTVIKSTDGRVYDSRTAVNEYIRADKEFIKLEGERITLLLKQQRILQEIDKLKTDGIDTSEKQQQLDKINIDLEKNDEARERQISAKNATNVEPYAQAGKLGKAEGLYKEHALKMRPEYVSQSYEVGTQKGLENKDSSNNSAIKEYIKKYREILDLQTKINSLRAKAATMSGKEKINLESYINSLSRVADNKSAEIGNFSDSGGEFGFGTLNGRSLTQSERETVLKEKSHIEAEMAAKTELANAQLKKQKGLLTQIGEGFKASFRNLVDYSLAYRVIGMINQGFQTLINTTKNLNTNMLNLRIVTGGTLQETQDLMKGYNKIAKEMGRTTQSVADASNDWLRAGYEGKDAIDLTRASLQLSTLGMIDSTTAATDLISALKGWKLEASEVSGVVDKLTVTTCGVCIVICIGHEFNCR